MLARNLVKRSPLLRLFSTKYHERMVADLKDLDPEVWTIVNDEATRIKDSICLIASENFTSRGVLQAVGTVFANKYAEGYPNARYYAGCKHIDQIELLAQKRALEAFDLDPELWGVNVQPLSGAPANQFVYWAIGGVNTKILGPNLADGGVSSKVNH